MLTIYLARHGQNEDNANGLLNGHRDLPLTELGVSQAHTLAEAIKKEHLQIDTVYTSPLCRASDTATIICNTLHLNPPIVHPLLIERDFGVMSGKPQDQIEALCAPDILKTPTITYFLNPSGAETFPELHDRAKRALQDITSQHREGTFLLVTHGDIGKMIYAAYYNLSWKEVLTSFHFGNADLLLLSPATDQNHSHVFSTKQYNT